MVVRSKAVIANYYRAWALGWMAYTMAAVAIGGGAQWLGGDIWFLIGPIMALPALAAFALRAPNAGTFNDAAAVLAVWEEERDEHLRALLEASRAEGVADVAEWSAAEPALANLARARKARASERSI